MAPSKIERHPAGCRRIHVQSKSKMVCSVCGLPGHNATTCGKRKPAEAAPPVADAPKASAVIPPDDWRKMGVLIEKFNEVAKALFKGRAENVYQSAVAAELQEMGVRYTTEETIPILYKGIGVGFERMDIALLTWLNLIIELKAVSADIKADNHFQVLNYMRYKGYKYGVVVNFCQASGRPIQTAFVMREGEKAWLINWSADTIEPLTDYEFA